MSIILSGVTYVAKGLTNGTTRYFAASVSGVARFFANLAANVTLAPQFAKVHWKLAKPFEPTADTCPCPGEKPIQPTLVDITVRFDARVPQAHRDDVYKQIKDLVANAEFSASLISLTQPAGT